jgi:hypothetical protein
VFDPDVDGVDRKPGTSEDKQQWQFAEGSRGLVRMVGR